MPPIRNADKGAFFAFFRRANAIRISRYHSNMTQFLYQMKLQSILAKIDPDMNRQIGCTKTGIFREFINSQEKRGKQTFG